MYEVLASPQVCSELSLARNGDIILVFVMRRARACGRYRYRYRWIRTWGSQFLPLESGGGFRLLLFRSFGPGVSCLSFIGYVRALGYRAGGIKPGTLQALRVRCGHIVRFTFQGRRSGRHICGKQSWWARMKRVSRVTPPRERSRSKTSCLPPSFIAVAAQSPSARLSVFPFRSQESVL